MLLFLLFGVGNVDGFYRRYVVQIVRLGRMGGRIWTHHDVYVTKWSWDGVVLLLY